MNPKKMTYIKKIRYGNKLTFKPPGTDWQTER
jgi:hypothetical protein